MASTTALIGLSVALLLAGCGSSSASTSSASSAATPNTTGAAVRCAAAFSGSPKERLAGAFACARSATAYTIKLTTSIGTTDEIVVVPPDKMTTHSVDGDQETRTVTIGQDEWQTENNPVGRWQHDRLRPNNLPAASFLLDVAASSGDVTVDATGAVYTVRSDPSHSIAITLADDGYPLSYTVPMSSEGAPAGATQTFTFSAWNQLPSAPITAPPAALVDDFSSDSSRLPAPSAPVNSSASGAPATVTVAAP
jgi:outer membrane biogenesis lipoprotein LolB